MVNASTRESASAGFAPSLADRIKYIVAQIGVFFDFGGYKKEITKYERELED